MRENRERIDRVDILEMGSSGVSKGEEESKRAPNIGKREKGRQRKRGRTERGKRGWRGRKRNIKESEGRGRYE